MHILLQHTTRPLAYNSKPLLYILVTQSVLTLSYKIKLIRYKLFGPNPGLLITLLTRLAQFITRLTLRVALYNTLYICFINGHALPLTIFIQYFKILIFLLMSIGKRPSSPYTISLLVQLDTLSNHLQNFK